MHVFSNSWTKSFYSAVLQTEVPSAIIFQVICNKPVVHLWHWKAHLEELSCQCLGYTKCFISASVFTFLLYHDFCTCLYCRLYHTIHEGTVGIHQYANCNKLRDCCLTNMKRFQSQVNMDTWIFCLDFFKKVKIR